MEANQRRQSIRLSEVGEMECSEIVIEAGGQEAHTKLQSKISAWYEVRTGELPKQEKPLAIISKALLTSPEMETKISRFIWGESGFSLFGRKNHSSRKKVNDLYDADSGIEWKSLKKAVGL